MQHDALDILRTAFGFNSFRPGQGEVIDHLLAGRSAAAVFPTGAGKSLCYQLPALMLPGLTLVVSPLIALMKDQIDQLTKRGIPAARIDSTLTADESREVWRAVERGNLRLLYVAPERFNNERFREMMAHVRLALFAVDEAHCISEWGHNFRPDYLKLAAFAKQLGAERVLALTATATPQVLDDICRGFDIDPACSIRTGFYRPNLTLLATPASDTERDGALLGRLKTSEPGPTIVYVTLQRTAERVADLLADAGYPAQCYHAGMEDSERARVQEWFAASDRGIVVATIAFGMGIDKGDIRYVYHFNLPKSIENYSQEIGRAGRDGLPSTCELFVCPDDINTLENFVYGDTPSAASIQSFIEEIFSLGDEFDVSLMDLAARHDIRLLVVRTLLAYLELSGHLEETTSFFASYQFRPLVSSGDILGHFDGERRAFLAGLFREARQAKTWFHIDVAQAARRSGEPRERFIRALDYLVEQGWIELKAEGVRNRYRRLLVPADLNSVATELMERTFERERRELGRLTEILEIAGGADCIVGRLSAHFGEQLDAACGHCSHCLTPTGRALPSRTHPPIDERLLDQARAARNQHLEALGDDRALARFLCGLTSPRVSRARLGSHPLFGSLGLVPFSDVLTRVAAL
jgi:ATP-dependent DNA helicase RecQ